MAESSIVYSSTTDSTAITITLASLATSSTLVAGRESTVIDNSSAKHDDILVFGQITTGTSPTVNKTINLFVYYPIKIASSTYTYPVAGATNLTGADAAATFDAEQRAMLKLAISIVVNATSDRAYPFSFSLRELFGDAIPPKVGIFVTQDTGVSLNSTAANHFVHWVGIKHSIV